MRISDGYIRELCERTDMESVVSEYVELKRRGKTLAGLCPFHNEKTPSFTVYPDSRSFYCFGCGAGGDVISFVRRIENLDYVEAVKALAKRAGMPEPDEGFDDSVAKAKARILSANREAAKFFHARLIAPENKAALDYFLNRGVNLNSVRRFGLGYAPDDWRELINHMRSKGYDELELERANLARRSVKSGASVFYDAFRNRVMFPIINVRGDVIAFGGRVLDDSKPKYVNTSDTLVYKKSRGIFGLNLAKNSGDGKLTLVEGYMDVIALNQAGFTNAVACLGTAFTAAQANLLSRYADEIIICYDSDDAGKKATERALTVLGGTGLKLRVIRTAGGKDPDEIIRKYGKERFADLIKGAANRTEYRLLEERTKYNLETDDGKLRFLTAACDVLAVCGKIERDIYAARLSNELGTSADAIKARIEFSAKKRKKNDASRRFARAEREILKTAEDKNNPERIRNIGAAIAEERLISSFMKNPDFYFRLKNKLSAEDFITGFNRRVFERLARAVENGTEPSLSLFSDSFTPEEMDSVSRILVSGDVVGNSLKECEDCVEKLKKLSEEKKVIASDLNDEEFSRLFLKK